MKTKINIVILAGGQGKRMESDKPKALVEVKGKPMIKYLLESITKSDIKEKPIIVVGYKKEEVIEKLGNQYDYVIQEEQLGTGHAVLCTQKVLENNGDNILVLYGDHPLISANTINKLTEKHLESMAKITIATVKLPDFEDWRAFFYTNFSRIIRDENGEILKSVEFKDANEEERKNTEINPCYFCFNAKWLWENLKKIQNNNAQKEYYLTDLIKIATEEKLKIESISIEPIEAIGANTKEELEILEKLVA